MKFKTKENLIGKIDFEHSANCHRNPHPEVNENDCIL